MSQMAIEQQEENTITETPENSHGYRYNLRKHPTKHTNNMSMTQTDDITGVAGFDIVTIHPKIHGHVMLMQMNAKQGLMKYGSQAILKELRQLHNTGAILPVRKDDMSYEERRKALKYLMFLKEKRDGTIKAQGCTHGRPQRLLKRMRMIQV